MREIKNIAFLGLGVMGGPMAMHLQQKTGCTVTVYNRTPARADDWVDLYKGRKAGTPAAAAQDADLILICVGNDDDLRSILTAPDGVFAGASRDTIIIDHTTVSAKVTREMADFALRRGLHYIDAPVSGGQAGAVNGAQTVMCGGNRAVFDHVAPLLKKAYAREIRLLGPAGSGQTTKMINQICIAGAVQGLAEGLAFGMKAGLDMDEVLAVIGKGAAQSWQMDNRGKTMVRDEFDFGFALDWMIKDLSIVVEEAHANGAQLDITPQILEFYRELSAAGFGRCDTSALIRRLIKPA
jgi:3-hydroxyisobutyrate dehydrogenase-like beta-hydroxyacid dehydrogenase